MTISDIIEEWATELGYKYYDENIAELKARIENILDDQYRYIGDDYDENDSWQMAQDSIEELMLNKIGE